MNIETSAQDIALVQVDHLLLNTSAHDGVSQAQVDDSYCNTSANGSKISSTSENALATPSGSDLVQVVNLYKSATGRESDLVQVVNSYKPSKFQREGPSIVKCSRGIKRKRSYVIRYEIVRMNLCP